MRARITKFLRSFSADPRGTITVEFMVWVPILVFWMLGTVVFFDAYKTRSALISANSTIADIISRNSEINTNYMNLLELLQVSLVPNGPNSGLRISSVLFTIDPDIPNDPGTFTVQWSAVAGTSTEVLTDATLVTSAFPEMYSGESMLLVESVVPYKPLARIAGFELIRLRSTAAISARYDSRVVWVGSGP